MEFWFEIPKKYAVRASKIIQKAMETYEYECPILCDIGAYHNWYEGKGEPTFKGVDEIVEDLLTINIYTT